MIEEKSKKSKPKSTKKNITELIFQILKIKVCILHDVTLMTKLKLKHKTKINCGKNNYYLYCINILHLANKN